MTGQEIQQLEGSDAPPKWYLLGITSVAVSGDGARVLTGSLDRTARLWDVSNWKEIYRLVGYANPLLSISTAADGRGFLTVDGDPRQYSKRTNRWWDAISGNAIRRVFFSDLTREPLQYLIRSHF
jgi:WD40 repeat protein